ncbi:hypothetical protein [Flavobacterium agri]|nr:hypothetical protein [Flavobacterium agri]
MKRKIDTAFFFHSTKSMIAPLGTDVFIFITFAASGARLCAHVAGIGSFLFSAALNLRARKVSDIEVQAWASISAAALLEMGVG